MRVLPADAYDTLEFSALVFGGIGAGKAWCDDAPCCVFGLASYANPGTDPDGLGDVHNALVGSAEIWPRVSDEAVRQINDRKNREPYERVTFAEWTKELSVMRGR